MKVFAHRGFWQKPNQKNSIDALKSGILHFDGVETDLRDFKESVVISHDAAKGSEVSINQLFACIQEKDKTWALNIKADGISDKLYQVIQDYDLQNYFTFDMSIPEMYVYKRKKIKFYTSWSDLTPFPVLLEDASGIWLDSFTQIWYNDSSLAKIINLELPVCFVSEDLHHRDIAYQWALIRDVAKSTQIELAICTDKPIEAKRYFCNEN